MLTLSETDQKWLSEGAGDIQGLSRGCYGPAPSFPELLSLEDEALCPASLTLTRVAKVSYQTPDSGLVELFSDSVANYTPK